MLCNFNTLNEYIDFFDRFSFGSIEIIIDEKANNICWFSRSIKNRHIPNNIDIEKFGNNLSSNENNILCFNRIFQALKNKSLINGLFITKLEFQQKIVYAKVYANMLYSTKHNILLGCYCVVNFIPNYSPIMYSSLAFKSTGNCLVVLNNQNDYNHLSILLNQREHEIITLLSMYKSHKEISSILTDIYEKDISPTVVTTTISRSLYSKLQVDNTAELVCKAIELGVLDFMPASLLGADF
jgi:DNA-binding CsgD family transcriptional regulator